MDLAQQQHPERSEPHDWRPAPTMASRWAAWVPAAFVLFSIFALLVGPLVLSARIQSIREAVVEPGHDARGQINEIRHAMTRGEAAVRGLLLSTDARFVETLIESHEDERQAFERLLPLARRLDPELGRQVEHLRAQSERASEARAALFDELRAGDIPTDLLAREEERHARLVAESETVKDGIIVQSEAARAEIRRLLRLDVWLSVALSLLALFSALVVLRIGRAHRLRAQEEANLRAAAFSLTEVTEVGEVLHRIAGLAARPGHGESSYVERIDQEAGGVEVVAAVGTLAPPPGTRVPYPGSLAGDAVQSGSAEVVPHLGRLDRPMSRILAESCDDCGALVIPLMSEHHLEGALVVLRPPGKVFGEREIEQRRAIGVLAALALRKAVILRRAQEQHETLQRLVESRDRLVRSFSHDVKNPLGAAAGHAQLLADGVLGDLAPRQKESVLRIRTGIGSALELIGNLIELARNEAGALETAGKPVDIADVVCETARVYRATADIVGLRLETELPEELPTIRSDPERIGQVLGNLVSNAIKYTPAGGTIRLSAELRGGRRAGDSSRWVTLSVSDTGPGIAPEEKERLFDEFRRLEPDTAKGEGLGLASSDRVATMLGGEITVDSAVGEGSTFTLWLPLGDGDRPG